MPKIGRLCTLLLVLTLLIGWDSDSLAQRRRKKGGRKPARRGDVRRVKAPKLRGKGAAKASRESKGAKLSAEEQEMLRRQQEFKKSGFKFDPYRQLSVVAEDTNSLMEGEQDIVEISEQIRVDSSWINIAEYYQTWDSRIVNPYKLRQKNYDEPIYITLYDSTEGRYYAMPQRKTHINSPYGPRGGRNHWGIDLELDVGDTIYAAFDGVVRIVRYERGWGNFVLIRHYNGLETLYGHLSKQAVSEYTEVKAGDVIGFGGSTGRSSGPHLHLEVRYEGNALNPEDIFDFKEWKIPSADVVITPESFNSYRPQGGGTAVARRVIWHRVRSGETLYGIARKYNLTTAQLAKLNGLSRNAQIRSGKRLRVR